MRIESTIQQDRYFEIPAWRPYFTTVKRAEIWFFPKFLLTFYALFSMVVPLVALSLYRASLESKGVFVDSGCHGPDAFFGLLTGMIFCLLLRFGFNPFFPLDGKSLALPRESALRKSDAP